MKFDASAARACFPALSLRDNGQARIYLDNPAGTQVPSTVVRAVSDCMWRANANLGGPFASSRAAGAVVADARQAMADLLNAGDPAEIVFGPNMTTLTFQLSRALGHAMEAGDEIIVTELDHDANVTPWVLMARDFDLRIRKLRLNPETYRLDLDHLDQLLNDRTRLVCVGHASNLLGTINDIQAICDRAHAHDAFVFVDAVHSVPHLPVDVQQMECDLLVCSPYKFFGPHQGVLWGPREVLDPVQAYKLRPAPDSLPGRFETGTQSHEAMAGVSAAIDYLAGLVKPGDDDRRARLRRSMQAIQEYEVSLCAELIEGLLTIEGLRIHGITDELEQRTPTVSLTIDGHDPADLAEALGKRNIFAWSGHSYAVEPCKALGLLDSGGVLRVGLVHYNNSDDISGLISALETITATGSRRAGPAADPAEVGRLAD